MLLLTTRKTMNSNCRLALTFGSGSNPSLSWLWTRVHAKMHPKANETAGSATAMEPAVWKQLN